ncbi:MAG: hypothetical protein U5K27_20890 [Desulfotignum sp.]|nr:hypothetical protein [Desulfotignum sp.]
MVNTLIDQISEDNVETIHESLLVLDSDLKVILANRNFIDSFFVMAEGREELRDIMNSGFIGKPINTRTFAKEVSQFIK